MTLTLIIFTIPLLRVWENAVSNYNLVLGLLPWSDAAGYYSDAITLIQGGLFSEFSGHRPLFAGLLAALLKLSSGNIQIVIVVLTIINSLSVFLFAWEINETFGPLITIAMVLILQIYYRQFAGVLLTEQLGLSLGLISLTGLIYATRDQNFRFFCGSLFLFALALFARAGAFFTLPAIFIFGSVLFKKNERFSIKNIAILLSMLFAAWGLNYILGQMVAAPGTVSLGNFSYTLYGQAVGGKGWSQVFIDHPELSQMSDTLRTQAIYKLALQEILRNPSGITTGIITSWRDYFNPSIFAGFGFIQPRDNNLSRIVQIVLTVFLFIGVYQCWKRKKSGVYLLLLAIASGIFISIPFIPPSESAGMRIYAATIAIPSLLATIGLVTIFPRGKLIGNPAAPWTNQRHLALAILGIILIFFSTFGAIIVKTTALKFSYPNITCQVGEIPILFQLARTGYIKINTNESGRQTNIPDVSARDFRQSFREFPGIYHDFSESLIKEITPPVLLSFSRNMLTGDFLWLIIQPGLAVVEGKTISACGKSVSTDYPVYSVKIINNP